MKVFLPVKRAVGLYIVIAFIIGAVLGYVVPSIAPGPIGDCYDGTWLNVPVAHDIKKRADIIAHYDHIIAVGSKIMLATSLVVLVGLIFSESMATRRVPIGYLVALLFIMACYGLAAYVYSGPPGCGFGQ